ncbi:calcineurin-like phosphoesterase C-terminal domain-containing protein [Flagellimonas hadalis]|uniref:Metallophosphoesterase n=1 Tax=Flagellimonas hadalis TaxID=2597517 RepID=A0A5N5ISB6_9FLAO|nr:calcineurin-like phosphoesterase family protein [Allomuricauda hadalis]KAB5491442.1 metallophosphoesterase [Allomuricauda hadalis]
MENRRAFIKKMGLATGSLSLLATTDVLGLQNPLLWRKPTRVKGKVANGRKGLTKVAISDGETVILTDQHGNFDFWSTSKQPFVFVSIPSGFQIDQLANGSASFFKPLDLNSSSNEILFQLKPVQQNDDKHSLLVLADPQIQNEYEVEQLLSTSTPDFIQTIKDLNDPNTFGVGCGDLVYDRLHLFEEYNKSIKATEIPFFQVIGNHDMDLDSRTDEATTRTFNRLFGPSYYSFNRGEIHYVVLDDVFFTGVEREYIGYITENQLAWLEEDLKYIEAGRTVVLCVHIPIFHVKNKAHLYELLSPYKTHILSGHTHRSNNYVEENCYEHVHGAVCGAWWSGPICVDGTPNGYGVYQVNGSELSWYYKSVGKDKSHQFRFYERGAHEEFPNSCVLNIWNWDPNWSVCWYENGERKSHIRKVNTTDPLSNELHLGNKLPERRPWAEPAITDHMFFFEPSDINNITIEVSDNFGNTFVETVSPN